MNFSRFFVDKPIFAAVLSIIVFVAGLISIFKLPVSEYPEVVPPSVVVRAVYPRRSKSRSTVSRTCCTCPRRTPPMAR
jgi:multidrug efflux pump subunit AcrB